VLAGDVAAGRALGEARPNETRQTSDAREPTVASSMGSLRFFRRVKVLPGLTLNLSKSGPSVSMGVRGAHMTFGRSGARRTVGIPGTGIFYTSRTGNHTGVHRH
jgi:hypothetical protein